MDLTRTSAGSLSELIRSGRVSSEEVTKAFLDRIESTEDTVQAWVYLNRDHAIEQARRADRTRMRGETLGRLHGVPVGIKDIIDTADMPTEYGTVLYSGWQPAQDAAVISHLRSAGAVIMGKTVTAELAFYAPGKTRNPRNSGHTPGGSSSGSAAAVAAGMVPLAIGTQTNGSVIRPAAFCGVVGFKPTHGRISRHGVLHQSWIKWGVLQGALRMRPCLRMNCSALTAGTRVCALLRPRHLKKPSTRRSRSRHGSPLPERRFGIRPMRRPGKNSAAYWSNWERMSSRWNFRKSLKKRYLPTGSSCRRISRSILPIFTGAAPTGSARC